MMPLSHQRGKQRKRASRDVFVVSGNPFTRQLIIAAEGLMLEANKHCKWRTSQETRLIVV
jgi:hypothetical protein